MAFQDLTYKRYKEIAENFLKENPYGLNRLPTNIEILIGKCGYFVETEKNLYKDFSVKGLVAKHTTKADCYRIIIDLNHYENQPFECEFTLAEELAHIILHNEMYDEINDINSFIEKYKSLSDEDYRKYEQQAKVVASHLLLPQNKFDDYILTWVDENITKLRQASFSSKEHLSSAIARSISKRLKLSEYVIRYTILGRYPDLIIDKILEKYGYTLIK